MKRNNLFFGLLFTLILLLAMSSNGAADTSVSGIIDSDTTWTLANSPYIVTGNVLVNEGVTLTIEPGVEVKFDSGNSLQLNGELVAQGISDNLIIFTSNQPSPAAGDWGYIDFGNETVDASYDGGGNYSSGTILEYVKVLYGGGSGALGAVVITNSAIYINNLTFKD